MSWKTLLPQHSKIFETTINGRIVCGSYPILVYTIFFPAESFCRRHRPITYLSEQMIFLWRGGWHGEMTLKSRVWGGWNVTAMCIIIYNTVPQCPVRELLFCPLWKKHRKGFFFSLYKKIYEIKIKLVPRRIRRSRIRVDLWSGR